MKERVLRAVREALWDTVPAEAISIVRAIIALHALWMLLSRPDLPALLAWPHAFWSFVPASTEARFGLRLLPVSAEWGLYFVLHVALLLAACGVRPRATCGAAALLLYHFAPVEEVLTGNLHSAFGGLTMAPLGLGVLAVAEGARRGAGQWHRWPLTAIRLFMAMQYFGPFLSKLRYSSLRWFTGGNLHEIVVTNAVLAGGTPWSAFIERSPPLLWLIAVTTLVVEALFPLVVFSHLARRLLVPSAAIGHVGVVFTMGIYFPSLPLLLLYVDWEGLVGRVKGAVGSRSGAG